jgi:hypothetical protein
MTTAVLPFQVSPKGPLVMRAPVLAAVVGMHAAVVAGVLHVRFDARLDPVSVPLDVRMIEAPASLSQAAANTVIPPPAQPMIRRARPAAQEAMISTSGEQ